MPHLDISLFGGFLVRLSSGDAVNVPTKKSQALLAYLAVPPGQAHALAIARARGERGDEAWALHLIGTLPPPHMASEAAETTLIQALALASTLGMRPLQARSRLALGCLLHRSMGRLREARNDLTQATEDLRTMGMMFWVAEAEALLAAQH